MSRMTSIAVATACAVVACKQQPAQAPGEAREPSPGGGAVVAAGAPVVAGDGEASWALPRLIASGDLGDGLFTLPAVSRGSLALVPIATTEPSDQDYLVLDDALAEGLVEISERGPVNSLTIANRSDRPLFLLAGEVIIGGKQDRIIGKNTIIAGKATEELPVFCVEHGRWGGQQGTFTTANALAHSTLRQKASFEGQGDVWREVAAKNALRKTSNSTDTYRQTAAQQHGDAELTAWDADLDGQLRAIPEGLRPKVVGYAVALGGELVAVDVFDSPRLFARLDRKLRRSYYAEAIDAPPAAGAVARLPTTDDVRAFMTRVEAAPEAPVYGNAEADTVNQAAEDAVSTKVMAKKARPGGGKARPVFKSVQKKAADFRGGAMEQRANELSNEVEDERLQRQNVLPPQQRLRERP